MLLSARALILSTQPYSDTSLIVRTYTREHGLLSFIFKGIKKGKKGSGVLRVMHIVDLVFYKNNSGNLHTVKESKTFFSYTNTFEVYQKNTILIFLSEVLQKVLKEENPNSEMFDFIEASLRLLDASEEYLDFHLCFLIYLSKHLGFAPLNNYSEEKNCFHLVEGRFVKEETEDHILDKQQSDFIYKTTTLPSYVYTSLPDTNNVFRRKLLRSLCLYFSLHSANFRDVKSIVVLECVFSD